MVYDPPLKGQKLSLGEGFRRSGLTLAQAWVEYLVMGGQCSRVEVIAALRGGSIPGAHEHDKLAAALNETFAEAGDNHPVAYSDSPEASRGPGGPR